MSSLGDWLTAAGRLTGLYAGYTIAVVLLLMSTAPWIDHGLGSDRLARWHAMGGRYLISLLTAHALLITWGYALTANSGVLAQTKVMLFVIPDVMLATIGMGLFLLVGAISARQVRKRVSYETWYLLHLLTYVAVGLSFLHVLSAGADFQTGWAQAAWIGLYAAVGTALLWYRWVRPIHDALRHRLRVGSVTQHAPEVVTITVTGVDLLRLGTQPGQFFRWRFLTARGWWQSHPFSLSAMPTDRELRITVKALGDYSRALQALRPGTRVIAEGPYGAFTPARRRGHGVLLVAGGIGITPLRTMLEAHRPEHGPITLVYRAERAEDMVLDDELDLLTRADHVTIIRSLGPRGAQGDVLVDQRLAGIVPDLENRDAFVCGPPAFMDAAADSLRRCGVPDARIHTEHFGLYGDTTMRTPAMSGVRRPAIATAGTVLGIMMLLGGKALTAPSPLALTGSSVLASNVSGTANGPVINTRYGPAQVQVTATAGKLTDVSTLQLPTGGRSGLIADYAAPILQREALAAQSAGIHAVSGATYTSQGYAQSLQAALDQLSASTPSATNVSPGAE